MPLYEYRCRKCGARVEKIQKFSDAPLTKCEKCGGELERLLSPPAVQFKGTGWYVTDYARRPSVPESEKPTVTESSSEKGGKSETGTSKPRGAEGKSKSKTRPKN